MFSLSWQVTWNRCRPLSVTLKYLQSRKRFSFSNNCILFTKIIQFKRFSLDNLYYLLGNFNFNLTVSLGRCLLRIVRKYDDEKFNVFYIRKEIIDQDLFTSANTFSLHCREIEYVFESRTNMFSNNRLLSAMLINKVVYGKIRLLYLSLLVCCNISRCNPFWKYKVFNLRWTLFLTSYN